MISRPVTLFFSLLMLTLLLGCDSAEGPMTGQSSVTELQIIDHAPGTGTETKSGMRVTVNYTGWLYDENAPEKKGKKFDSSFDRNRPLVFSLGRNSVIQGWEQGLLAMREGGKRTLIIPPQLGYGAKGAGELTLVGGAPAVALAIENAINKKITKIPVTPEYIMELMNNE